MLKLNPTPHQAENVTPLRMGTPGPVDPVSLLAKAAPPAKKKWLSPKVMLIAAGGLLAAQLILPYSLKPAVLAGEVVASFSGQIMAESARQQLYVAEQQEIAKRIGEQEAERATWHGNCALLGIIGAWTLQEECKSAVDQKFEAGANRARNSRLW